MKMKLLPLLWILMIPALAMDEESDVWRSPPTEPPIMSLARTKNVEINTDGSTDIRNTIVYHKEGYASPIRLRILATRHVTLDSLWKLPQSQNFLVTALTPICTEVLTHPASALLDEPYTEIKENGLVYLKGPEMDYAQAKSLCESRGYQIVSPTHESEVSELRTFMRKHKVFRTMIGSQFNHRDQIVINPVNKKPFSKIYKHKSHDWNRLAHKEDCNWFVKANASGPIYCQRASDEYLFNRSDDNPHYLKTPIICQAFARDTHGHTEIHNRMQTEAEFSTLKTYCYDLIREFEQRAKSQRNQLNQMWHAFTGTQTPISHDQGIEDDIWTLTDYVMNMTSGVDGAREKRGLQKSIMSDSTLKFGLNALDQLFGYFQRHQEKRKDKERQRETLSKSAFAFKVLEMGQNMIKPELLQMKQEIALNRKLAMVARDQVHLLTFLNKCAMKSFEMSALFNQALAKAKKYLTQISQQETPDTLWEPTVLNIIDKRINEKYALTLDRRPKYTISYALPVHDKANETTFRVVTQFTAVGKPQVMWKQTPIPVLTKSQDKMVQIKPHPPYFIYEASKLKYIPLTESQVRECLRQPCYIPDQQISVSPGSCDPGLRYRTTNFSECAIDTIPAKDFFQPTEFGLIHSVIKTTIAIVTCQDERSHTEQTLLHPGIGVLDFAAGCECTIPRLRISFQGPPKVSSTLFEVDGDLHVSQGDATGILDSITGKNQVSPIRLENRPENDLSNSVYADIEIPEYGFWILIALFLVTLLVVIIVTVVCGLKAKKWAITYKRGIINFLERIWPDAAHGINEERERGDIGGNDNDKPTDGESRQPLMTGHNDQATNEGIEMQDLGSASVPLQRKGQAQNRPHYAGIKSTHLANKNSESLTQTLHRINGLALAYSKSEDTLYEPVQTTIIRTSSKGPDLGLVTRKLPKSERMTQTSPVTLSSSDSETAYPLTETQEYMRMGNPRSASNMARRTMIRRTSKHNNPLAPVNPTTYPKMDIAMMKSLEPLSLPCGTMEPICTSTEAVQGDYADCQERTDENEEQE